MPTRRRVEWEQQADRALDAALALGPRLGGKSPSLGTIDHDSDRGTREVDDD
jgi:hypothetical protein